MKRFILFLCLGLPSLSLAAIYDLPRSEFNIVGHLSHVTAAHQDTLVDIAQHHGVGWEEMISANPGIDRWLPGEGTEVLIPSRYILPDAPREGLVLNLPEMRLYHYLPADEDGVLRVETYPVSIGRMNWSTPLGKTTVVAKQKDPAWYPPKSIKKEHAEQGDPLPDVVPPGPDNPLGQYAVRLAIPGYLIHGTNKPLGIGMRVSHGCIRMLPADIERLFPQVKKGTPMYIINQPIKAGWYGGGLYVEVHTPLDEYATDPGQADDELTEILDQALRLRPSLVDEERLKRALDEQLGVPVAISYDP